MGEQVCDGSYIAFVMKKVNGPALRFAIGRATRPVWEATSRKARAVAHPPVMLVNAET